MFTLGGVHDEKFHCTTDIKGLTGTHVKCYTTNYSGARDLAVTKIQSD